MKTVKLDQIVRHKDPELKQTVEQLARGEVREAVAGLERQGRIHEFRGRGERVTAMPLRFPRTVDLICIILTIFVRACAGHVEKAGSPLFFCVRGRVPHACVVRKGGKHGPSPRGILAWRFRLLCPSGCTKRERIGVPVRGHDRRSR
jgi:hypothetical protein